MSGYRTTKVSQKLKVLPEQPEPVTQSQIKSQSQLPPSPGKPIETETIEGGQGLGEQDDEQSEDEGDDEGGPEQDEDDIQVSYLSFLNE